MMSTSSTRLACHHLLYTCAVLHTTFRASAACGLGSHTSGCSRICPGSCHTTASTYQPSALHSQGRKVCQEHAIYLRDGVSSTGRYIAPCSHEIRATAQLISTGKFHFPPMLCILRSCQALHGCAAGSGTPGMLGMWVGHSWGTPTLHSRNSGCSSTCASRHYLTHLMLASVQKQRCAQKSNSSCGMLWRSHPPLYQ